jgi:hypothetical protein
MMIMERHDMWWWVVAMLAWMVALLSGAAALFVGTIDATNGTLCQPLPCRGEGSRAAILAVVAIATVLLGAWFAAHGRRASGEHRP